MALEIDNNIPPKEAERMKAKRIINKVVDVQLYRFQNQISTWKNAILDFENKFYPTNEELIRAYNDAVLDPHLSAIIDKRKNATLSKDYKFVTDEGEEITDESHLMQSQWFRDAISIALDSLYFGFSLVQFGDRIDKSFKSVSVVDREYVYPIKQIVRSSPSADSGVPYNKGGFQAWNLEAGKEWELGILAKSIPFIVYKNAALGSWANYMELFGSPLRIGKTNATDETIRDNMFQMLENMGNSAYGVFNHDDEIELLNGNTSDAHQTFDKLIDRVNSELSKLILGSTMTVDDGSSRSQSEVHEKTTGLFEKSDALFIESWVNKCLIPFLNTYHGFGINGRFMFDDTENISIKDQFEMDITMIKDGGYKIPAEYMTEKYGTPVEEVEPPEQVKPDSLGKPLALVVLGQNLKAFTETNYFHVCNQDEIEETGADAPNPNILNSKQENQLYKDLFNGEVTINSLPVELYVNTGEYLTDGIEKGLSLGAVQDPLMFDALRDNAFVFSGAKTANQVLVMSSELVDENGEIRTFSQFRKRAKVHFNQFNKNWLRTEYNQALSGSQMASNWQELTEDEELFPLLEYIDQHDGRVRKEHSKLDGIIRPVNDPFWDVFYPPNGWNCRCNVLKLTEFEGKVSKIKKGDLSEIEPEFRNNVGKTRQLFTPEHPYFINVKQFKGSAKENFNLPEPPKREFNG